MLKSQKTLNHMKTRKKRNRSEHSNLIVLEITTRSIAFFITVH